MANEISIKFNSVNLESNMTVDKVDIKEKKSTKTYDIPKIDGSVAEVGKRKSLTITIEGKVYADDYDALRANLDSLRATLQNGLQKLTKDDDRYIMAQLQDFTEDVDRGAMRVIAEYKASFIAHYPFWLSETEYTDERVPTSGAGYTISNIGNAPSRIKAEFSAPSTAGITDNLQMENLARGELFKYRGTVAAGKKLEIDNRYDTDDFEVLNDGVDGITDFEGDFLNISDGINTFEYTGLPGATVKLSYRAAWY